MTLNIMRNLVKKARSDPQMIAFAHSIISGVPEKDDRAIIERVFRWVRDSITYRSDPNDVETLRTPERLIRDGYGDCDDKATLLSALLEALGYKTRFMVIGFAPDTFEHVYNEVLRGETWIALDSTEAVEVGWSPLDESRPILSRMPWRI